MLEVVGWDCQISKTTVAWMLPTTRPKTPGKRSTRLPWIPENGREEFLSPAPYSRRRSFRLRNMIKKFDHTHTDSCIAIICNSVRARRKWIVFAALASQQRLWTQHRINPFWLIVPKTATIIQGFDARLANRPFLVLTFRHSGAQGWAPECPKVKN